MPREPKNPPPPPGALRPLYEQYGAEGFYRHHAGQYANPHFPEVAALLERNASRWDNTRVLDFAAGGGEASLALQHLGITAAGGCDPFTWTLYEQQTGLPCLRLSFDDVIRHGLPGRWSAVICSFALHLAPEKDLFPLTWQLLQAAPKLVVISPHKRPDLSAYPAFHLDVEDHVLTQRGKKVRLQIWEMHHTV